MNDSSDQINFLKHDDVARYGLSLTGNSAIESRPTAAMPKQLPNQKEDSNIFNVVAKTEESNSFATDDQGSSPEESATEDDNAQKNKRGRGRKGKHRSLIDLAERQQKM